jgi:Fe-S cluster assembly iron-binding protein IscA
MALLNPQLSESGELLSIDITPRAAHRLQHIMDTDKNPALCLRITVESGGCHGFQYLMSLTDTTTLSREDDTLFIYQEAGSDQPAYVETESLDKLGAGKPKVAMDSPSLELLEGSKIDYTMELIGSQFKIVDNPRATSSCGCGTSFDVKF